MGAVYIGHSLQIAQIVGEFFTTCNGQVPHLRLVNCGLALFLLAKNSLNNLRYCDYHLPTTDAGLLGKPENLYRVYRVIRKNFL